MTIKIKVTLILSFFSGLVFSTAPATAYLAGAVPSLAPPSSLFLNDTLLVPNDPYYSTLNGSVFPLYKKLDNLWGVKLLNAPAAWEVTRGAGILVAVVDTGVYAGHEDLAGNIWSNPAERDGLAGVDDDGNGYIDDIHGWDFIDNDNTPEDLFGHGTYVAGIIGALKDNGKGIVGVAPEASILPVRVLDRGFGPILSMSEGIRYAAKMGAKVINISFGYLTGGMTPEDIALVLDAVRYARDLGSIVVASAGNAGGDTADRLPAKFDEVITVGALRHSYDVFYGQGPVGRASFSNQGEELDFMAPGVDILSLAVSPRITAGVPVLSQGNAYYTSADGTSAAAPMVSGTIALLLAQDPMQTFEDIYRRLRYSSKNLGPAGFDPLNGYGRVDALAALTHDYYDDGKLKTLWLVIPDRFGIVRYDYYRSGKVSTARSSSGDLFRYYEHGNRRSSLIRGVYEEFLDEIFYGVSADGHGKGRVLKRILEDGSETRYTYWYHTDKVKTAEQYVSDVFLKRTEYYLSGRVSKITLPDGNSTEYYRSGDLKSFLSASDGTLTKYLNEDFYGTDAQGHGRGRVSAQVSANDEEIRYDYLNSRSERVTSVKLYLSDILRMAYSYEYDSRGRISEQKRAEKDSRGRSLRTLEWENIRYDSSVRVKSYELFEKNALGITVKKSVFSGFVYEDSQRVKNYDRSVKDGSSRLLGNFKYFDFVYDNASRALSYVKTDLDSLGRVIETHQVALYDSGNAKSDHAISSNVTYQFYDEDFYGDQTGRYAKKINSDGSYTAYSEYWPGTDVVKTAKSYSVGGALLRTESFDARARKISTQAAQQPVFDEGYFEMLDAKARQRSGVSPYNLADNFIASPNRP